MPKIITINSLKGGVSKSTLTYNLYHFFTLQGFSCGIIDSDPQGSLIRVVQDKKDFPILPKERNESWKEATNIDDVDFILVDTSPYLIEKQTKDLYSVTDFLLIPCKASIFDVYSLNDTTERYYDAKGKNKRMKAAIVLTQSIHSTSFSDELRQALNEADLPVLVTEMKLRVDYPRSLEMDQAIFSTENQKAINEIKGIGTEIINLMK